jgi:CPA2 family monovalent cation:H+ antiporter-2
MEEGLFTPALNSAILPAIVITMILTPFIIGLVDRFYPAVISITTKKARELAACAGPNADSDAGHIIIAGYGRVGQNLASGLDNAGIPYMIIDIDPECLSEAKACKLPHIYGDASNVLVLSQADLCNASAMVVTFPDP